MNFKSMEFFNPNSNVNFMGVRKFSVSLSMLLILASIVSLSTRGLNFALDFTGGTLVDVIYDKPVDQGEIVKALDAAGFHGALVQRFNSTSFAIRLAPKLGGESSKTQANESESQLNAQNAAVASRVKTILEAGGRHVTIKDSGYVGPQVGKELATNGIVAVVVVLTGIALYIWVRFEWRFALGVIMCELHDVILTLGFFSMTGLDFDLTVLAAVLAVDGYSVNDTIVVFDRVRELFRSARKGGALEILNKAVNSTLSRTIMTSLATMLTVMALFLFGGPTLHGFSLALIVGIVVGTLSSIFFACPMLYFFGVSKQDLMPKLRDDAELARRP
jgi:preprotein translocase subunit SecF